MLHDIKNILRVSGNHFDIEILDLIDSAKIELGITNVDTTNIDSIIKRAITVYVKAHFGWDNPEAEKFMVEFERLKQKLSQVKHYMIEREDEENES